MKKFFTTTIVAITLWFGFNATLAEARCGRGRLFPIFRRCSPCDFGAATATAGSESTENTYWGARDGVVYACSKATLERWCSEGRLTHWRATTDTSWHLIGTVYGQKDGVTYGPYTEKDACAYVATGQLDSIYDGQKFVERHATFVLEGGTATPAVVPESLQTPVDGPAPVEITEPTPPRPPTLRQITPVSPAPAPSQHKTAPSQPAPDDDAVESPAIQQTKMLYCTPVSQHASIMLVASPGRIAQEEQHDRQLTNTAVRVDGCDMDLWPAEKDMFEAVNRQRLVNGRPALTLDKTLVLESRQWSWAMKTGQQTFHHSSYGGGENIAMASDGESVEKAMAQFMSSPGHRANILSRSYTKFGASSFGDYSTQRFR